MNKNLIAELMEECKDYDTKDLQHDLAQMNSSNDICEMSEAYTRTLLNRGEKLPVNCKLKHNPVAYMKKELQFDLA